MIKCCHSQHDLKVYGKSEYTEATCPKCLIIAQQPKKHHHNTGRRKFLKHVDKDLIPGIVRKSKCPTPFTDTISHFPSPGGEAELNSFRPHLPLINNANEIRPSEVAAFSQKLKCPTSEILNLCKSPWDKEASHCKEVNEAVIETKQQSPKFLGPSTTDEKFKDIQCRKKLLEDKQELNKLFAQLFYQTSTQRFYEGVDWKNIVKAPHPSPLPPSKHDCHELYRRKIKRYQDKPEYCQRLTGEGSWDFFQSRDGHFVKQPIAYMSESRKTHHIPNYSGVTTGIGEKDVENEKFIPTTMLRTLQPKSSATGRKPHLPGYTGCIRDGQYREAFSSETPPRAETTARTYTKFDSQAMKISKNKDRPMYFSNSVTLTHPFNPYNKLDPSADIKARKAANAY